MAAVNSVSSSRLTLPAFSPRAVLMYSAALGGEGSVALQLREATPGEASATSVALQLRETSPGDTSATSAALAGIACHDPELLADLLHAATDIGDCDSVGSGNFASLISGGYSGDRSKSNSSEDFSDGAILTKISSCKDESSSPPSAMAIKKLRPKPSASPNRQGPQQCQVCNKVFGNASALAKHKLTHSDERKYVCPMCTKAFKRQDHLNGHMLTHRNKKPYECKADGCGKSYCDARSLRRHTENHHHDGSSKVNRSKTPNGCIRMPSVTPATRQQPKTVTVLTSIDVESSSPKEKPESQKSPIAVEKLEKADTPPTVVTPIVKTPPRPIIKTQPAKPRTWAIAIQHSTSQAKSTAASSTSATSSSVLVSKDFKPVECNLCHRKFKNIPALNGHMRLHGGYFKKDSDSKKNEKKESTGPPLQTASVSVRALIEEKIISRRGGTANTSFATPAAPSSTTRPSTSSSPKPPSLPAQFVSPRPLASASTSSSSPVRDSTLIELLKRSNKGGRLASDSGVITRIVSGEQQHVKRCASDPGHVSPGQIGSKGEFGLGVSLSSDDGYYSPALTDDAFQFTNTPENLDDIASLEDYASVAASIHDRSPVNFPSNRRLQAVLNSPLPEGLADFGAYHTQGSPRRGDAYNEPSLSYPTPPASHEARSPTTAAPRASSPLSAAFYTATMSSAEEVEEALEEVLPEECPDSLDVYQALEDPNNQPAQFTESRMMLNSDDPLLSSNPRNFDGRRKAGYDARLSRTLSSTSWPSSSGLRVEVEPNRSESLPDVFLSPSSIPASPQRPSRKRTAEDMKDNKGKFHKSIMRQGIVSNHYTPPPMLYPNRYGHGLYSEINIHTSSESDSSPHYSDNADASRINIGSEHQALIPELQQRSEDDFAKTDSREQLLWDPGINESLDDNEVRVFLELCVCAAMPVGGHSRETALRILGDFGGDVRAATLHLMTTSVHNIARTITTNQSLYTRVSESTPHYMPSSTLRSQFASIPEDAQFVNITPQTPAPPRWSPDEVEMFLSGLREKDKNFAAIAQMVKTKSTKDCVQFYYLWKKVTKDYKTLFLRSWSPERRPGKICRAPSTSYTSVYSPGTGVYDSDEFPCKICGKVFTKIKSRSAHMKSHRPPDAEPKRLKIDPTRSVEYRSDTTELPTNHHHDNIPTTNTGN